jgi:tRNA pseudouridine55 synthase
VAKSGLILVDKPAGFTSHDVVAKARKILGTRKVGHAGTLDPMATGLLVLGVEAGTKLLTFIVGNDKTYEATISLGVSTVTDDVEGEVLASATPEQLALIHDEAISKEIQKLTGVISQVPASVSAIKVAGVRSYDLVREGKEVELAARTVTVSRFEVVGEIRRTENAIELDVIVDCSSGTYIRALARDLGNQLGVGGHLTKLRRSRVGEFSTLDATGIEDLDPKNLIGMKEAAAKVMPLVAISEQQVTDIRHGKRLQLELAGVAGLVFGEDLVAVAEPVDKVSVKSLVVFSEVGND